MSGKFLGKYVSLPLAPDEPKPKPKHQRYPLKDHFWHVILFLKFVGRTDPWAPDGKRRMGPGFAWEIAGILAGKHQVNSGIN